MKKNLLKFIGIIAFIAIIGFVVVTNTVAQANTGNKYIVKTVGLSSIESVCNEMHSNGYDLFQIVREGPPYVCVFKKR